MVCIDFFLFNKPEPFFPRWKSLQMDNDLIFFFHQHLLSQFKSWKIPAINSWNVTHWNQGISDCTAVLGVSHPNRWWKDMSHVPLWNPSGEEFPSTAFIVALETWGRDFYIKSTFLTHFFFTSSLFSIQWTVPVLIIPGILPLLGKVLFRHFTQHARQCCKWINLQNNN